MAVRVKLQIKNRLLKNKQITACALVNSGFETEEAELILPKKAATILELFPKLPKDTIVEEYEGITSIKVEGYFIKKVLEVNLEGKNKTVITDAVILNEKEIIISDALASELGIIIEDLKKGYWRIKGEKKETIRKTVNAQYW